MEFLNLSAMILFWLSLASESQVKATPLYRTETAYSDAESIQDLLALCNKHPSLCSNYSDNFYTKFLHAFRQSGVKKTSALLMTDILQMCINKGLEECDIENTAIAMSALSEQKKPSDSIKSTQQIKQNQNDIERYDTHKDNQYTLAGLARPDSISKSKPKFRLIRTKREDNSGSLPILTHNISKRALGGIIRKMIRGLCRSDPLSCYDVTLIHPNQRKRITNYR